MNLNELFRKQAELDKRILDEHNLVGQDLSKKKTVALLTELFETMNEARFFKFWSEDQKPRMSKPTLCGCPMCEFHDLPEVTEKNNPLLEEYVDSIHFTLSKANDYGYHEHEYKDPGSYDLNNLVLGLAQLIATLPYVRKENQHKTLKLIFNYLIKLGYMFGFDEDMVIQAYYEKNKENFRRQEAGY